MNPKPNLEVPIVKLTNEELNSFSCFMEKWQSVTFALKVRIKSLTNMNR